MRRPRAGGRARARLTGRRPLGPYQGRSSVNTLKVGAEEGGFLYLADAYADELPYWQEIAGRQQLIVPCTLDANDTPFATQQGFNSGDTFFAYLKYSFDVLCREGGEGLGGMLSVGPHCRFVGRPGRAAALARFLDYVRGREGAWVAKRLDVARHWALHHPPAGEGATGRAAWDVPCSPRSSAGSSNTRRPLPSTPTRAASVRPRTRETACTQQCSRHRGRCPATRGQP